VNETAHPYYPIVPPMTTVPRSVPRFGEGELPQVTQPSVPMVVEPVAEARKRLLTWGAVGVGVGAAATAAVTALAFQSYKKKKSVLGPALWSAAGSVVFGGSLLLILSYSLSKPLDQRLIAATVGAKLAV
jgi:hypothetical protein